MNNPKDPIEAFFSQPIPQEVWHYTSLSGFQGIVSSNRVWATEARFSNDKTEFVFARDIAAGVLTSLHADGHTPLMQIDDLAKMLDKAFDEGALSPLENQIYIASFSTAPDLLSQWGRYATYQGVSIGFDLRELRPPAEWDIGVTFAPCVYEKAEQEYLIRAALERFTKTSAALYQQTGDQKWLKSQIVSWNAIHKPPFNRMMFDQ